MLKTLVAALMVQGLTFGATDAQIDQYAKVNGFGNRELNANGLFYNTGRFGGRQFTFAKFGRCKSQGLHTLTFLYAANEGNYKSIYSNFVDLYKAKYKTPTNEMDFYMSPFRKGDGYEWTAIRSNKGYVSTSWVHNDDEIIMIEVNSYGNVVITYQSSTKFDGCKRETDAQSLKGI